MLDKYNVINFNQIDFDRWEAHLSVNVQNKIQLVKLTINEDLTLTANCLTIPDCVYTDKDEKEVLENLYKLIDKIKK